MSPKSAPDPMKRRVKKAWKKWLSPGPRRDQVSVSIQSERQEDRQEDRPITKDPSRGTENAQPCLDSSEEDIKNEAGVANPAATASPEKHCSLPKEVVQAQHPSVEQHGTGKGSTAQGTAQNPPVSKSQEIWNDAFNRIEEDPDAKELVEQYMKILKNTLGGGESDGGPAGDAEADPSSAAVRQRQMVQLVKAGQDKIKKASKITKSVGSFVETILVAKPLGDFVIQNVPQAAPAALPWASVCAALQILCKPANADSTNLEGVKYVVSRMEWYCALTDHILDTGSVVPGDTSTETVLGILRERVVNLYRVLLLFLIQSVCSYFSHQAVVFLKSLAGCEDWTASLKSIKAAELTLNTDSEQYNNLHAKRALQECSDRAQETMTLLGNVDKTIRDYVIEQERKQKTKRNKSLLTKLFVVNPLDDLDLIEGTKDALLYDAYKWILDMREFKAFTDENHDGSYDDASVPSCCRLLWIKGHAGTGKTMLLLGIIRELSARSATLNPSISHFFFQNKHRDLTNNTAALRSLLWMLLVQQPNLISHLRHKYENAPPSFDGDRAFTGLSKVFESMLTDPDLKPVYFIVDALDECDHGLPSLIELISKSLALSDKVKWLVSSRPTVPLRMKEAATSLLELDSQKLKGPVAAYIHHQLSRLTIDDGYTESIIHDITSEITRRAENTFLWVWLIFQQLTKPGKWGKTLNGMYALRTIKQFPPGLSDLYDRIMKTIEEGKEDDPDYCKTTLKAVYLAYRPLTLSELTTFVSLPQEQVIRIVDECGSFLTVTNDTVNLIHQSANDYLKNNYSSRLDSASVAQGHAAMCQHCLDAMDGLHKNMYHLHPSSPYPIDAAIPQPDPLAPMRYACVYWVDHLRDASDQISTHEGSLPNTKRVYSFLQKHFLHWIESLTLLRRFSDGITSIKNLQHLVPTSEEASELADFVYDTSRFIKSHRSCIEKAPLQAYASALLFSPTNSKVRRHFEEKELDWIKTKPVVQAEWDSCTHTLEGHDGLVTSVVVSPDRTQLASASADNTVKVWDVESGECMQTLKGHNKSVWSVNFLLPDGKQLVSRDDKTVKVWDVESGECMHTFDGRESAVESVAFSLPDGKQLEYRAGDETVKVWDVASGECTQTLNETPVQSVTFLSPDGKQLASSWDDDVIKIWDMALGDYTQKLESYGSRFGAISFSSDGKQLASASDKSIVKVWDVASGKCTQTLEDHDFPEILSLVFSPDGKFLAFNSDDMTVKIWDVASGECTQTLEGHDKSIAEVVFSLDGRQLASCPSRTTVRIWDVTSGECTHTLEGHNDSVRSLAFSPDGRQLVAVSSDDTAKVWNAALGECTQTLKEHKQPVQPVIFLPDGRQLASGALDMRTESWDEAMKRLTKILDCYYFPAQTVVFSPDGKQLAVVSDDMTVKVWNVATGECTRMFEGYTLSNLSVFFSLDRIRDEEARPVYALNLDGTWITKDKQELLWLPYDYRPRRFDYALYGRQSIGLGLRTRRVITLQF